MGVIVAFRETEVLGEKQDTLKPDGQGNASGHFLQRVSAVRQLLGLELPIQNSLIALDILNSVALAHFQSQPLSVKGLMAVLPHSLAGLRYHYSRLLNEGWILTVQDRDDARIRWVRPTDRLLASYQTIYRASQKQGLK